MLLLVLRISHQPVTSSLLTPTNLSPTAASQHCPYDIIHPLSPYSKIRYSMITALQSLHLPPLLLPFITKKASSPILHLIGPNIHSSLPSLFLNLPSLSHFPILCIIINITTIILLLLKHLSHGLSTPPHLVGPMVTPDPLLRPWTGALVNTGHYLIPPRMSGCSPMRSAGTTQAVEASTSCSVLRFPFIRIRPHCHCRKHTLTR